MPVKKSYLLQKGDVVAVAALERYADAALLEACAYITIPIVYETLDYCVIEKPKGVLSHPNSIWDVKTPSVIAFLYHHYKKILPSLGHQMRAGLLHRLDKDTDGFMLIAKTEKGLTYFKSLFHQKSCAVSLDEKESVPLRKWYTATCFVSPLGEKFLASIKGKLPWYIQEEVRPKIPYYIPKLGITKIVSVRSTNPSPALPLSGQGGSVVTLSIEILTGRTHQIRYHLSEKWLPIIGDKIYGEAIKTKNKKEEGVPLLQLTASHLSFLDCYGEMKVFQKQN